eukprot:TRINITY_DN10241_c0_g1_i1.p1 TRINITY_DN10241_c0_g1~~TRINITY_DN10241_c0_g1_i1.p1  ORF type:complete len:209 (-),score=63.49 TRINITY_DN10241_c0_g1_i1:56-682(-)
MKKYKDTMAMIVKQMSDQYWCNDCGRVLCDKHRYQHTCERIDAEKERNAKMTNEELRERMEREAALKLAAEEAAKDEKRAEAEALERVNAERKGKRKLIAGKAQQVSGFLQQLARNPDIARRPRVQEELGELYTRANRIALTLYNEYETPSMPGLAEDDWQALKETYERARELTGMVLVTEDGPFQLRNPWDPPPAPGEEQMPQEPVF